MKSKPMVSVAIPTYNQEKYISTTIDSVLSQKTNFDFEVVIGDDCSTDATRVILDDFCNRYPDKIRVIRNDCNLGLVLNVKKILDNCCGKYVALLGGDDYFCRNYKLQIQYDFLEQNHDYGLVHSDACLVIKSIFGKCRIINSLDKHHGRQVKTGYVFNDLLLTNFISAGTVLFRKDLYLTHADFELWHRLGFKMEDYPMWLEFSRVTKFGYIKEALLAYRILNNSISHQKNRRKYLSFWVSFQNIAYYFYEKYGADKRTSSEFLNKYHLFYLENAFIFRNKEMAANAVEYFKSRGRMSKLKLLYYLGTRSWFVWFVVRVCRKLFKSFRMW